MSHTDNRRGYAAVITAAGASSRMGTPKALVPWRGRPLLEWQLGQLEGFGQRIVVLGSQHDAILERVVCPADVLVLINPDWPSGRSSSLRCALREVPHDAKALLICGVDQPIEATVLQPLLAAFAPATHAYAVPRFKNRRGHPLIFSGELLSDLRDLKDTQTLRDVTARYRSAGLEVACEFNSVVNDLNTPFELQLAQSRNFASEPDLARG